MEKHSVSRLSYLFAHLHLLSSYSFSSTLLSSNLPLLSASSLLCFSSVHIVGSLTSKLPSIIYLYIYVYGIKLSIRMYVRTYQRTLFLDTCLRLTNPCKDPPVKGRPHTHPRSGSRSAEEFRTFSNAIHLNLLNQTCCGWKKSYTRW